LLQDLLRRATALEAKYVIKIISGDRASDCAKAWWKRPLPGPSMKTSSRSAANMLLATSETLCTWRRTQTRSGADAAFSIQLIHAGQPGQDAENLFLLPSRSRGRQV